MILFLLFLVIYKSFLAEIEPQKRIYSLAIERHNFQRLQVRFLISIIYNTCESNLHLLHSYERSTWILCQ